MRQTKTVCHEALIGAPCGRVFDLLTDWPAIIDWMPEGYIRELQCDGEGQGAVRHLVTARGVRISERLDEMNRGQGLIRLSILDPLPWNLLSYAAVAQLRPADPGNCSLNWCGTFKLPASDDGSSVEKLLKASYRAMFRGIGAELARHASGE